MRHAAKRLQAIAGEFHLLDMSVVRSTSALMNRREEGAASIWTTIWLSGHLSFPRIRMHASLARMGKRMLTRFTGR